MKTVLRNSIPISHQGRGQLAALALARDAGANAAGFARPWARKDGGCKGRAPCWPGIARRASAFREHWMRVITRDGGPARSRGVCDESSLHPQAAWGGKSYENTLGTARATRGGPATVRAMVLPVVPLTEPSSYPHTKQVNLHTIVRATVCLDHLCVDQRCRHHRDAGGTNIRFLFLFQPLLWLQPVPKTTRPPWQRFVCAASVSPFTPTRSRSRPFPCTRFRSNGPTYKKASSRPSRVCCAMIFPSPNICFGKLGCGSSNLSSKTGKVSKTTKRTASLLLMSNLVWECPGALPSVCHKQGTAASVTCVASKLLGAITQRQPFFSSEANLSRTHSPLWFGACPSCRLTATNERSRTDDSPSSKLGEILSHGTWSVSYFTVNSRTRKTSCEPSLAVIAKTKLASGVRETMKPLSSSLTAISFRKQRFAGSVCRRLSACATSKIPNATGIAIPQCHQQPKSSQQPSPTTRSIVLGNDPLRVGGFGDNRAPDLGRLFSSPLSHGIRVEANVFRAHSAVGHFTPQVCSRRLVDVAGHPGMHHSQVRTFRRTTIPMEPSSTSTFAFVRDHTVDCKRWRGCVHGRDHAHRFRQLDLVMLNEVDPSHLRPFNLRRETRMTCRSVTLDVDQRLVTGWQLSFFMLSGGSYRPRLNSSSVDQATWSCAALSVG